MNVCLVRAVSSHRPSLQTDLQELDWVSPPRGVVPQVSPPRGVVPQQAELEVVPRVLHS